MKFSLQWLSEFLALPNDINEIENTLTMAGLEVAEIKPVAGKFSGVSIAKIISAEQHPNADRLRICQVATKDKTLTIVCGAPNARAGLTVALAEIGAELPGGFQIKRSKIRGQESEGMLCSAKELGLNDETNGIIELPEDAPIGMSLRDYLNLDEQIIEVEFTPNRGDCLSMQGLAREYAALTKQTFKNISHAKISANSKNNISLNISEPKACPIYTCRLIKNINPNANLPAHISQRLERMGIRSVNAIVDIVNYVMLELGQPLHAFDKDKITDEIILRFANQNENITLLNQQTVELNNDVLVIADNQKAIAMAGIMGSLDSSVDDQTKNILLESALFNANIIAGKARRYGLHTDASFRFERGVDKELPLIAIERATQLIIEITGGEACEIVLKQSDEHLPTTKKLSLTKKRVNNYLGINLSIEEMADLLKRLNMQVEIADETLNVIAPSYRYDINISEDLIEEIARLHGYNQIPAKKPVLDLLTKISSAQDLSQDQIKDRFVALGYFEAINYSFISKELQTLTQTDSAFHLLNPISSELSVMRTSLLPSLLSNIAYNQNRQQDRVRLFEISRVYQQELLSQPYQIAAVVSGTRFKEQWAVSKTSVDFFDAKADVLAILNLIAPTENFQFEQAEHALMQPGQTAKIIYDNKIIGHVGALHPAVPKSLDLLGDIFLFELDFESLQKTKLPRYQSFSKFPAIRRDLAFFIQQNITSDTLIAAIKEVAGPQLMEVNLFDVYRGKNMPEGMHSIALSLTLQDKEKTLNDEEINLTIQKVITDLSTRFQAKLRD